MKKKSEVFRSKERKTCADVAAFLRGLADKVAEGRIVVRQGEKEVVLEVPEELVLELKAREKEKGPKGTRQSLELELEWYTGTDSGRVELG